MTNPHVQRIPEIVADVRRHAAAVEHEWDRRSLDWPLTQKSVVVEVGGYVGRWALQIAERYHPRLYVFEPQPWAAAACQAALGDAARVLNYGLGDKSGVFPMGGWETDGCSFVKDGSVMASMREVGQAFAELRIRRVALMLINIEGGEYALVPRMLDCGILPKRLMVQFHPFTTEQAQIGRTIETRLADLGYRIAWSYGVMLTAWERP